MLRPRFSLWSRARYFFEYHAPMMVDLFVGYAFASVVLVLAYNNLIPGWLASPLALGGWGYANYIFWGYQAWRSSGPRGQIINPRGPSGADAQTAATWFAFGVFLHLYHVWLRSPLRHAFMRYMRRMRHTY